MATKIEIRMDYDGIGDVAKNNCRSLIEELTAEVAANVQVGSEYPVETNVGTTDRAIGSVTIAHPAGLALQAKYGSLTNAASAAGLEVTGG